MVVGAGVARLRRVGRSVGGLAGGTGAARAGARARALRGMALPSRSDSAAAAGGAARLQQPPAVLLVRQDPLNSDALELRFRLGSGATVLEMRRAKSEALGKTLSRMSKSLGRQVAGASAAVLRADGQAVSADATVREAFCELGRSVRVEPREQFGDFEIAREVPEVEQLDASHCLPIEGCPIVVVARTRFADHVNRRWEWSVADEAGGAGEVVGRARVLVPRACDVGRLLCARLDLEHRLALGAEAQLGRVLAAPEREAVSQRLAAYALPLAPDSLSLRAMTYNLLADAYSFEFPRLHPYCDPAHCALAYRLPLQLREVLEANCDVVALQEVDCKAFELWLFVMQEHGYQGFLTPKAGPTLEGSALFWRADRLSAVELESICFRSLLNEGAGAGAGDGDGEGAAVAATATATVAAGQVTSVPAPGLEQRPAWMHELLRAVPEMERTLQRVPSVAQLAVLRYAAHPERCVVVTNTHSYYHPRAGSVRAVQAKMLLAIVERKLEQQRAAGLRAAALLCGDWNAQSFDASIRFMLDGRVGADHPEWASSSLFRWGCRGVGAGADDAAAASAPKRPADPAAERSALEHALHEAALANDWAKDVEILKTLEAVDGLDSRVEGAAMQVRRRMQAELARITQAQEELVAASPRRGEPDVCIGVGVNLVHGLTLASACGTPPYTNFAQDRPLDLDWIIHSSELRADSFAETPSVAVLTKHTALPSRVWPSDHVSQVAQLSWAADSDIAQPVRCAAAPAPAPAPAAPRALPDGPLGERGSRAAAS